MVDTSEGWLYSDPTFTDRRQPMNIEERVYEELAEILVRRESMTYNEADYISEMLDYKGSLRTLLAELLYAKHKDNGDISELKEGWDLWN